MSRTLLGIAVTDLLWGAAVVAAFIVGISVSSVRAVVKAVYARRFNEKSVIIQHVHEGKNQTDIFSEDDLDMPTLEDLEKGDEKDTL